MKRLVLAIAAIATVAGPLAVATEANAQPRRGYERDYGYRDYGRRDGFGDDRRRREGYGYRQPNPMAGMSIEDQKRAIKNERKAQKKAFKQGIFTR